MTNRSGPGSDPRTRLGGIAARWIALCIAVTCFGFGMFGGDRSSSDARVIDRLSRSASAQGQAIDREIRRTGTVTGSAKLAEERAAQLELAARSVTDSTATVLRVQADFVRDFGALVAELESCMKAFESVGGADPVTIRTRQDLALRRTALRHAAQANREVHRFAVAMARELRARLDAGAVAPDVAGRVIEGFESSNNTRQLIELRAQSARVLKGIDDVLGLLDEQWGRWRIAPEDQAVEFVDAAAAERYNALLAVVDDAARREAAMQARMLSATAPRR